MLLRSSYGSLRRRTGVRGQRTMTMIVVALLTLASAVSIAPTADAQDLTAVRRQRAALQARLDEAAQELSRVQALVAETTDRRDALAAQLSGLESTIDAADARMASRVREIYKRGAATNPLVQMLEGQGLSEALDRAAILQRLVRGDRATSEVASAGRTSALAVKGRMDDENAALDRALAEQSTLFARLQVDLSEASALEVKLERDAAQRAAAAAAEREAERQAAIRAAGGMACPLANPRSFSNDWGQPRSGGRSHRGTDIIGQMHSPVFAIVGGTIDLQRAGRSAGNWLMLNGVDGSRYWYLHLQSFLVRDGQSVRAGQQIATNGMTGNARGTVPHIHFEIHPGGGSAINPYHTVKRACG